MSDLRVVKLVRGIPRVPPTREGEKGKQRHGDYAIALALAHFASRMRWVEYGYRAVPRGHTEPARRLRDTPVHDDGSRRDWYAGPLGARLRGGL